MRKRRFELAAWQVYECGKQWREADADVAEAIDFCEYYAREAVRLTLTSGEIGSSLFATADAIGLPDAVTVALERTGHQIVRRKAPKSE